jgi:ADP-ribose pyrophosphatase
VVFDGYFQMVRFRFRHWQFAGGMGPELDRLLFERGHAAAVLPYDPVRDEVVLIEQFRIGAFEAGYDPWLLEPVAGIIEAGETAEEVARRETVEEAGLAVFDLAPVCTCLVSPGGSSETLACYVGRVDASAAGGVFGLVEEGEDIKVHVLAFSDALARLDQGRLNVASTLLLMHWLARHHDGLRSRWLAAAPSRA